MPWNALVAAVPIGAARDRAHRADRGDADLTGRADARDLGRQRATAHRGPHRTIGPFPALVSAKLLACVCGYVLYQTASHRPLAVMAGLYIGVAITPWLLVLGGLFV